MLINGMWKFFWAAFTRLRVVFPELHFLWFCIAVGRNLALSVSFAVFCTVQLGATQTRFFDFEGTSLASQFQTVVHNAGCRIFDDNSFSGEKSAGCAPTGPVDYPPTASGKIQYRPGFRIGRMEVWMYDPKFNSDLPSTGVVYVALVESAHPDKRAVLAIDVGSPCWAGFINDLPGPNDTCVGPGVHIQRIRGHWRNLTLIQTISGIELAVSGTVITSASGSFNYDMVELGLSIEDTESIVPAAYGMARWDNLSLTESVVSCSTLPAVPGTPVASNTTATTTVLSWAATKPYPGCSTLTYTLYNNGNQIARHVSSTSVTVSGLLPKTTYTFAIAAENEAGTSARSNPVTVHTSAQSTSSGWPARIFAPYVELVRLPHFYTVVAQNGIRYVTLAFVVANGNSCSAYWEGVGPVSGQGQQDITQLRAAGGDVILSVGGYGSTELAEACGSVPELESEYRKVINLYQLTRIDLDIEGKTLYNGGSSIQRRNKALAALQTEARTKGKRLDVQYTFPVEVTGLLDAALNVIRDAIANGVELTTINIMAMDFDSSANPNAMGYNAVAALNASIDQIYRIYEGAKTRSQIASMMGVIVLIGRNGSTPQMFTLDKDAPFLLSNALALGINELSFWSIARDLPCSVPTTSQREDCSGTPQPPYGFSQLFRTF